MENTAYKWRPENGQPEHAGRDKRKRNALLEIIEDCGFFIDYKIMFLRDFLWFANKKEKFK